jgi:PAS domain S-box-containing protein
MRATHLRNLLELAPTIRALLNATLDAVIVIDAGGRITEWSDKAEATFGWSRSEAIGRRLGETIIPPASRAAHECGLRRFLSTGETAILNRRIEMEACRRDGRTIPVELTVTVLDENGSLSQFLGIVRDLSERKRAEKDLRFSHRTLRMVVQEREQILQNLHDNVIQSLYAVGLALEECQHLVTEEPGKTTDKLTATIAALNRIIRDIRRHLLSANIETERLTADELRTEMARQASLLEGTHGFRVRLRLGPKAIEALAPEQRAQVLHIAQEAMNNCHRHSRGTRAQVSLCLAPKTIRLQVRDDGIGFDPRAVRPDHRGLNNIAKRVADMGGTFRIARLASRGTQLTVELPQKRD